MADLPGPSSAPNSPELPGPSTAPISLSKSEENFSRLCLLIMTVCSDLFRDILSHHIQPGHLKGELNKNKNTLLKILKIPKHKQLLYPPSAGQSVYTKDMDLSLLYTLLRNICGIPSHQAGWGNTPNLGDNSLAACIERIREQKNAIASHSTAGEINDNHFQDIWNSLQTDIMNIELILIGGDMYERTVNRLFSCDLSPPKAQEHIEKFKRLYDKIEEAQSQTRHFHSWKKARINNLTMRQSAIKRKLIGVSASKKARIGRLEKQQSSATSDIKETLKETEEHILFMVQGRLSGNEERIKEMLKETEKNIFSMIQEKIMDAEEYILDTMQKKLMDTEKRTLNKMQEKLLETEERTLNTMHEKLLETEERTLNTMQEKLKTTEEHILNRVQDRLSGIEERIEGRFSALEKKIQDMKARHFSLVRTSTINLPRMGEIRHMSLVTSDRLWVSGLGTLKQVDATGTVIRTLDDKYKYDSVVGSHAVSGDGDLVFIAKDRNSVESATSGSRRGVHKMTSDGNITTLFTTDKYPSCLYCSHINGDILIGMREYPYGGDNALVQRCDNTGRKIQDIELDDAGERLYRRPDYITENRINGDIVVSDEGKGALVVVDRSGRHRFNYTVRSTAWGFYSRAVCTDLLGRILVLQDDDDDGDDDVWCISLLDKDGHFLTRLLTDKDEEIRSLCVDDNHNIYVGCRDKIKVYK